MSTCKLLFVGDIMPGGVLHCKPSGVSSEVKDFLKSFDIRIGTLECAIGNQPNFDPEKMRRKQDVIYAPNIDLDKLKELNINCVSLANNHVFDLGEDGLRNTIEQLDNLGIAHVGAGMNIEDAAKPYIVENNGYNFGFIGLCDDKLGYVPVASKTKAGVNSITHDYVSQIKNLSNHVDFVYIIIHWGIEHTFWPESYMLDLIKQCINAGASGIIGGHQHRVQPLIRFRNKPVFLGLGNFLFPPRYLRPPRPMFYPNDMEDTSSYPITDEYPWVTQPTYKIWKRLGRIGAIGSIAIGNNGLQEASMRIVEMNESHSLVFPKINPLTPGEQIVSKIIAKSLPNSGNYVGYKSLKFAKRVFNSVQYRIKRLIKGEQPR